MKENSQHEKNENFLSNGSDETHDSVDWLEMWMVTRPKFEFYSLIKI